MSITQWSDDIIIAQMNDEPSFSDEMHALLGRISSSTNHTPNVIVDMKDVTFLNSSNIAQLLRLRQLLADRRERLKICSVRDPVWSMLLITGLDKIFDFNDDTATALASLQIEEM